MFPSRLCIRLGRFFFPGLVALAGLAVAAKLPAQIITFEQSPALPTDRQYLLGFYENAGTEYLMDDIQLYSSQNEGADWNLLTNLVSVKIGPQTVVAGLSDTMYFSGARQTIYTYSLPLLSVTVLTFATNTPAPIALAVNEQSSFVLGSDQQLYSVNLANAASTNLGINNSGNVTAMAFGPDGLLYMLDAQNREVLRYNVSGVGTAILDGTMAISPGVQVNFEGGLAIGPTDNIYLSDGSGGGSAYNFSTGLLQTFAAPPGAANFSLNGQGGNSLIAAFPNGMINVVSIVGGSTDDGTVDNLYFDASAIPEPPTYAAVFGIFALGAVGLSKYRRQRWN